MIGILYDREFEQFEANLDWLERLGVLVERFDLSQAPQEVANRPAVQQILVREADRCFATDTGERVGGVARHLLVPCRWLGPWVKP
jgi:hypothetical protein